MRAHSRDAYSNVTATSGSATITLGEGEWEITSLAAKMGSQGASLNGAEIGSGFICFEQLDGDGNVTETHYLVSGHCTLTYPMVMKSVTRVRVRNKGQVKSYLEHGPAAGSTYQHRITMIYRRVIQ